MSPSHLEESLALICNQKDAFQRSPFASTFDSESHCLRMIVQVSSRQNARATARQYRALDSGEHFVRISTFRPEDPGRSVLTGALILTSDLISKVIGKCMFTSVRSSVGLANFKD